jgi:hypothetical protein
MKICSKCKLEKPFEAFHRKKESPDGYRSSCTECTKLRRLELKKNPLMQLEKEIRSSVFLENKLLRRENKKLCHRCKEIFLIDDLAGGVICKECKREKFKEYHEKNKEKFKEYHKVYHEKNKEKRNKQSREYQREYREKNKEKIKEIREEYVKEYREKNKEKLNKYQREYRLKKKLEKENKIDPKLISAFMEELINIKE